MIIRDRLRTIYGDYDVYIRPVLKFFFALLCILSINFYLGYMPQLKMIPVVLIGALFCSVTPAGTTAFVAAVFVIGHMTEVSLVAAAVTAFLAVMVGVLYLGFRPGMAWLMALIPLCFMWKIPFFIPVVLGLAAGASAAVPVVCAIPFWFLMRFVHDNAEAFQNSVDLAVLTQEFTTIANGVLKDKYMYLLMLTFVLCILTVTVLKRLSIDHAWTVAVFTGIILEAVLGVGGGLILGSGNLIFDVIGVAVSLVLALLYEYVFFGVDYSGTERLQFEDDDYYYYVKAVPKIKPYDEDERRE